MDGQFSDDFKAQYREYYGHVFAKREPNYSRCAHEVVERNTFFQCSRPNGHGPHGAWCKQHDPIRKRDKLNAEMAQRAAAQAAREEQWKIQRAIAAATAALEPALRQIAVGHNDPRALAESVIVALDAARATPTQEQTND